MNKWGSQVTEVFYRVLLGEKTKVTYGGVKFVLTNIQIITD